MSISRQQRGSYTLLLAALLTVTIVIGTACACSAQANEAQEMLNSANALAAAGDAEQARVLFQQIIEKFPGSAHAGYSLFGLAKLHMDAREDQECLVKLNRVLAEFDQPQLLGQAASTKLSLLTHRLRDYNAAAQFAEEWLEAQGPTMRTYDKAIMVINLAYVHDLTEEPDKAVAVYDQHILSTPALLIYPLYFERLMELQLKTGKADEALTTVRLAYVLCDYDQKAIEAASNLVKKVFASRGEMFKATQFFAAQEDPEAPNPLHEVPLPELTEQQLNELLAACGDDARLKVSSYLYAGDCREAMMAAQEAMAQAPAEQMLKALGEVARVFKARDLNLIRANQFLGYARTGEGENPLDGFWQEVE
jgi:tetratricopeptide (TPR) repeat protein